MKNDPHAHANNSLVSTATPVGGGDKEPEHAYMYKEMHKSVTTTMNIFTTTAVLMATARVFQWTNDEVELLLQAYLNLKTVVFYWIFFYPYILLQAQLTVAICLSNYNEAAFVKPQTEVFFFFFELSFVVSPNNVNA